MTASGVDGVSGAVAGDDGAGAAPKERPLPRSFDAVVVFILVQAHLVSVSVVLRYRSDYPSVGVGLALVGSALAVPLSCVAITWVRGGELPLPTFAAAGVLLLAVDVAVAATMRPSRVGAPSMWSAVAIGVTLLALCPYRPPRDIMILAGMHGGVIAAVLARAPGTPGVEPFLVVVHLSAALVPAASAAEYVHFYVRAVRQRQDAVGEQSRAQARAAASAAIRDDADRRMARLRTEVLPLLSDVAAGRRPVDDAEGACLATRLSAELRRELVEARAGAWLLSAPVAALTRPFGDGDEDGDGEGRPGVVLLDPDRLVGRLQDRDRAGLSAVLAALHATGRWSRVSIALSSAYPLDGSGSGGTADAFVTIVAHGADPLVCVDPTVAAVAARAGCVAGLEPPRTCVIDGNVSLLS